ncbi:sensor histidine kinase [Lentzea flaviverrucosa]|uniref:histidine kinase n=1 Tax=Lentzea flaviverrucosa TaxID=200379 RepID=A0A1H9XWZ1_9PSEU|nr:HAMP domain-containing sensor histidine kinase [Lentzea flaviverrucosa]RDI18330.1 two-component system OmpR family sensor kinase [Lentzea flaviverrucosa]SES50267.1 two-component system, OmpR family, sensor kinase [Lentzea flaviverrucosa]
MSSSLRPRTLRAKLVSGQIVLLTALCLVIGGVSVLALHAFLMTNLDREVTTLRPAPPGSSYGPPGINARIFPDGSIRGTIELPGWQAPRLLTDDEIKVLAAAPSTPHTVDLGEAGEFRVVTDRRDIKGLSLQPVTDIVWQMVWILAGLIVAGAAAVALAGRVVVRRALVPLDRVAETAARVSELPLHEGEVALAERVPEEYTDPDTEAGKVGLALNKMLGHVDQALKARHDSETRVRQFVADASHELRTPLAAIRGYAELTRRTGEDLPPAVTHAMSRVESEALRMTSLVEDLLLLARLDAGRPLESKAVDLSRLVLDVVGDARIAGPGHSWKLALPEEPVTVPGDVQRLHQVIGNLLSNARAHTPPGTTVTTGLSVHNGRVDLSVTDDGPGVPEGLEVFERFARGDSSRSRAAGSTGLGLSIVSAVVGAHDGDVSVVSKPGHTTFTVSLRTSPDTARSQREHTTDPG